MSAKAIFITGAASGIGREVARTFAAQGWFVGLADVNRQGLMETAAMLPDGMSSQHVLDVIDRAGWKLVLTEFAALSGNRLDVLFNNAGIGKGGPLQDMAPADVDALIAINLTGVINGTQAAFQLLKQTPDSCILNTCSASGIYGTANLSIYSATKFAVRGLTEAWDIEFRPFDIKARSLMPGFIDTNILAAAGQGNNQTGKERLESVGIEVSPVSIIGPAAWAAVHGDAVHTPVNKMAKKLMFSARWFPNRLRRNLAGLAKGLEGAVDS